MQFDIRIWTMVKTLKYVLFHRKVVHECRVLYLYAGLLEHTKEGQSIVYVRYMYITSITNALRYKKHDTF